MKYGFVRGGIELCRLFLWALQFFSPAVHSLFPSLVRISTSRLFADSVHCVCSLVCTEKQKKNINKNMLEFAFCLHAGN